MKSINKKTLICTAISAAAVALVIVVIAAAFGRYSDNGSDKNNKKSNDNNSTNIVNSVDDSTSTENSAVTDDSSNKTNTVAEIVDGPTFMYMVSENDDDYEAYMKTVEELKNEYKGKVNFNIGDVDENENMKMFIGENADTPCLIMMTKEGTSIAIEYNCTDKDRMKADIELALEK